MTAAMSEMSHTLSLSHSQLTDSSASISNPRDVKKLQGTNVASSSNLGHSTYVDAVLCKDSMCHHNEKSYHFSVPMKGAAQTDIPNKSTQT